MERRKLIDTATGIAGGLLLVLAVVLFAVLPQEEVTPATFRATYVEQVETIPINEVLTFTEQQTQRLAIPIESTAIHRISFAVRWSDDVAASLPDTFQFVIVAPDGERVLDNTVIASNDSPSTSSATGTPPYTYTAEVMELTVGGPFAAPPRNGPVPGEHLEEDAANAQSRLREELFTYEAGEWMLEIYLDVAGDCPPAQQQDPDRTLACQAETQNQGDDGNTLEVVSVSYTAYDVNVEEI